MPRTTTTKGLPHFVGEWASVTREPTGRQIDWDEVATDYIPAGGTKKHLPAGTVMALAADGTIVPRAGDPVGLTAIGLLTSNADEGDPTEALTGHGLIIGGVIYENLLPDADAGSLPADYKTELQAAGRGTGFAFRTYADNTAS